MWPWLSAIASWAVRLLGGWLPIGTKPVSEWLGKLLFAIGTAAMVFFLMTNFGGCKKKATEPATTQNLRAGGSITNYTYNVQAPRFGCSSIQVEKNK